MSALKKIFGDIDTTKTEELDDGTVKVYGYASTEAVDSDGETITAKAMKDAIPDYMKFGAVREMHSNKAAGTAIEIEVLDDGRTWFGAHVVDSEAVKKVKAGVYKGFSIGGKVPKGGRDPLNKTIINALNLVEVSLVDRPANQEAVFTCYKSESLDAPESDEADDVSKSMYDVGRFSELLQSIAYVQSSLASEAIYEGDNSQVPAQIKDWLKAGAAIFAEMAAEEVSEFVMGVNAIKSEQAEITKADELVKAGARFSKATKDTLSMLHKAMKECAAHLDALDYDNAEDADKVDDVDGLAKTELSDVVTKLQGELAMLKSDNVAKAEELTKAQARVVELEALPAPSKGVLRVVEKAMDILAEQESEVTKAKAVLDDPKADPVAKMKAIHKMGGTVVQG